jgi:hypothetical protein
LPLLSLAESVLPHPRTGDASPWAWEPLTGTDAVYLDGSQYGVVSCVFPDQPMKTAYIEIQG